ncbi:hypothetical protein Rs2_40602 [Raphanus sativus]|nr:hypothetical protein Rs2_40602 [Raphanus sativus]
MTDPKILYRRDGGFSSSRRSIPRDAERFIIQESERDESLIIDEEVERRTRETRLDQNRRGGREESRRDEERSSSIDYEEEAERRARETRTSSSIDNRAVKEARRDRFRRGRERKGSRMDNTCPISTASSSA